MFIFRKSGLMSHLFASLILGRPYDQKDGYHFQTLFRSSLVMSGIHPLNWKGLVMYIVCSSWAIVYSNIGRLMYIACNLGLYRNAHFEH